MVLDREETVANVNYLWGIHVALSTACTHTDPDSFMRIYNTVSKPYLSTWSAVQTFSSTDDVYACGGIPPKWDDTYMRFAVARVAAVIADALEFSALEAANE
jgi:hypothetical protein